MLYVHNAGFSFSFLLSWLLLTQSWGRMLFLILLHHLSFFLSFCVPFFFFQSYFYNDDTFNFNYAQAKASMGLFSEAEEVWFYFL